MSQGFLQLTSRCLNQPARGGIGGVVATSESQPDSCPLEPVVADAPANGACTTHYHEQQQHAPALAVSSEVITKSSTTGGLGSSKINIDDHPEPEPASSWDVSSNLKVAKIGKRKAGGWKTTPFIFGKVLEIINLSNLECVLLVNMMGLDTSSSADLLPSKLSLLASF